MTGLVRTWWDAFLGRGPDTSLDRFLVGLPGFGALSSANEMVGLAFKVVKSSFTPPFSWIREAVVETSKALRLVFFPLMVASLVYVMAFGSVLFGQIVAALGAGDRVGPGVYVGLVRELSTWLTFMVVAGVIGSALAGDLGTRRIRQELDALDVLGVDKIRTLIVPRVWALTIAGVICSMLVVLVTEIGVVLLNSVTIDQSPRTQFEAVVLNMNPYDVGAALIKHTILGFFVGIVACQRGLSARGGAEGVGRVVTETVVITFFGIWLINSLFNTGYLTIVPDAIGIRG